MSLSGCCRQFVVPAKAGTQETRIEPEILGPRFGGGDGNGSW